MTTKKEMAEEIEKLKFRITTLEAEALADSEELQICDKAINAMKEHIDALRTKISELKGEDQEAYLFVDPPMGHRYGFPKIYNKKEGQTLLEWLESEGYPVGEDKKLIELGTRMFYGKKQ